MADILVIGGANIDIKAKCAGAHVAATSNPCAISYSKGGVARNIAHNLGKLGASVTLMSVVGNDSAGQDLLRATANAGVDVSPCVVLPGVTGTYIAVLDEAGELITAANDMAVLEQLTPQLIYKHAALIAAAKFVVVDCNLREDTLLAIAALAANKMIVEPVSVSKASKLLTLAVQHKIFLATPNLDQCEALTQTRDPDMSAAKLHDLGIRHVVIHAASGGSYSSNGNSVTHHPSQATTVQDVTGAGDCATAGLVFGLAQGFHLAKAANLGQELAARVIASHLSTLD